MVLAWAAFAVVLAFGQREVPGVRYEELAKGINLNSWWADSGSYRFDHLESEMQQVDFDQIAKQGFLHVRLQVDPLALSGGQAIGQLDAKRLKLLLDQVDEIVNAGMGVVIDCHPDDQLNKRLGTDDDAVEEFAGFWLAFAGALKDTDPDKVFLEILDDPAVETGSRWQAVQSKVFAGVRGVLPKHTILVCAANRGSLAEFLAQKPLEDANVVYTFQFHDPSIFSQQGVGASPSNIAGKVPYPATLGDLMDPIARLDDEHLRFALQTYGREKWDESKIENLFRQASDWGRVHRRRVMCDSFGCSAKAPSSSRTKYVTDVVKALEANGIAWTAADYSGPYRIFSGGPGNHFFDGGMIQALLGQ